MGNRQSKLSPEQVKSLEKETKFKKAEIEQWYKGFSKDVPSGVIDEDQLVKIYKMFFPTGDPTDFAKLIFKVFDKDGNGTIDFAEFMQALSVTTRGEIEERLAFAFKLYDINDDGEVDYEEMLQVVTAIYSMTGPVVKLNPDEDTPEKRVKKIFDNMDKNTDKKLTREEFEEGCKKDSSILQALTLYDGLV